MSRLPMLSPDHLAFKLLPASFQRAITEHWLLSKDTLRGDGIVNHWKYLNLIAEENSMTLEELLIELQLEGITTTPLE